MAGNIIPAIASTNSIVSGLEVTELMKIIVKKKDKLKSCFVQNIAEKKVKSMKLEKPFPNCKICSPQSIPVIIEASIKIFTCGDLVKLVKENCNLEEFSINLGQD